jgi:heme/copper-type cytochrome/quinol oxidase subunit 1
MIFFVVVPVVFGFFGNFFIPYHVGSKDVAFPRINSFGFWIVPSAFFLLFKLVLIRPQLYKNYDYLEQPEAGSKSFFFFKKLNYSDFVFKSDNFLQNKIAFFNKNFFIEKKGYFFVKCTNSSYTLSGWTFVTPFSSNTLFTGLGSQDAAIVSVILIGISSTLSLPNLLITRRVLSIPGLKNRKSILPFLSINLFLVMRMLSLVTPVLAAAMIMLLLDRHWKTSFFDYSYGGDVVLFNHLFWFFGHPEVYVIILPAFGIVNTVIPLYNSKLLTSKNHLIWASYIMGYMGFLVWGHHMYLVGLDHKTRSLYSTITIMISLPAVIKIVNWTLTFINGSVYLELPILFSISFFFFFVSGGMTGMWLSHVSLNLYVHDTFYVVAHFHALFSSSTFSAIFAALFHYFLIIFNYRYNKTLGFFFLFFWNIGQWMTFVPIFWVGYNGLPRRYHDYNEIYSLWNSLSSVGHIFSLISVFLFFAIILESQFNKNTESFFNVSKLKPNKRVVYYVLKIKQIQKKHAKILTC